MTSHLRLESNRERKPPGRVLKFGRWATAIMPVYDNLAEGQSPDEAALRAAIAAEFLTPTSDGPDLIVERKLGSIHVYGIWSRFVGVDQYARSRILLAAFEETHTQEDTLKVTVAMGLTPEEAKRMGVAPSQK